MVIPPGELRRTHSPGGFENLSNGVSYRETVSSTQPAWSAGGYVSRSRLHCKLQTPWTLPGVKAHAARAKF